MENIDFDTYQRQANELMSEMAKKEPLLNAALGLTGEAGECADIVKKAYFQGHELDQEHLKEELGDVLWYMAEACYGLNIPLSEIASMNLAKLHKRYHGNRFSVKDSVERDK